MSLKDEIKELRGALKGGAEADIPQKDEVKKAVAEAIDKGAAKVEKGTRAARAKAEELLDPDTYGDLRNNINSVIGDVGARAEEFPSKYPLVTALAALGFGLAIGVSLGRKLR